ncbi:hypothetical protein [uncultured Winogradskyella sp.]|uniref:hypothetical protein n=1 Tax=uncultured Winogradskyella sp. TaxID=395353 RepID=UPI003513498F
MLLSFSCTNEESGRNSEIETIEFKTLMHAPVALEIEGDIRLAVDKKTAVNTFNRYAFEYQLNMDAHDVEIIEHKGKNYIRFYGKDGMVSTLELIKSENNSYITGSTICKSKACSTCCGCLPNGDYCTPCTRYSPPGNPANDCERTSGGPPVIE